MIKRAGKVVLLCFYTNTSHIISDFRRVSKKLTKGQIEVRLCSDIGSIRTNMNMQAVFQTYDRNKDGKLSFEDFKRFMMNNNN